MSDIIHRTSRCIWVIAIAFFISIFGPQFVLAAGELPILLAQQAADGARGPTVVFNRSNVLDGIIVVVLFGAALFAICRSSHRH